LLERLSDPSDRRAALLHVTGAGAARIRRIRRQRAEAITKAMMALTQAERKTLADAVPAMHRLLIELEMRDPGKSTERTVSEEARVRAKMS
jgi:DNA-binding MarR family transcriptional regulator